MLNGFKKKKECFSWLGSDQHNQPTKGEDALETLSERLLTQCLVEGMEQNSEVREVKLLLGSWLHRENTINNNTIY